MPPLVVTPSQIQLAQTMWAALPGWQLYDQALDRIKTAFPLNIHVPEVLIKATLLDKLYATNVYDLSAAANRIVAVFSQEPHPTGPELVMALSQISGKRLVSFASKYVHFYVDNTLALTDSYAIYALTKHFGEPRTRAEKWTRDYILYHTKLGELRQESGFSPTARELDHYLWLAGNWVWLQERGVKAKINKELTNYFKDSTTVSLAQNAFGHLPIAPYKPAQRTNKQR